MEPKDDVKKSSAIKKSSGGRVSMMRHKPAELFPTVVV
jgi:hypothetical protein